MARKTRKRYYRRKGRWSANIKPLTNQTLTLTTGSWFQATDLCINPAQSDSSVSQQYTVKNVEFNYELETSQNNSIEGVTCYIMYVPQGMTVTETFPIYHPEYIMAYKFIGTPEYQQAGTNYEQPKYRTRIKSRLARRLQTGDKVIFLIIGTNTSNNNVNLLLSTNGLIR